MANPGSRNRRITCFLEARALRKMVTAAHTTAIAIAANNPTSAGDGAGAGKK